MWFAEDALSRLIQLVCSLLSLLQQLGVGALAVLHQLLMVSVLDHLALVHHQDELGVTNCAQPVGYDHLRATSAGEVLNHPLFSVGIQG